MSESNVIIKGDLEFPPRKVWFKTFGCQMNYHDTERMMSHLEELNFTQAKKPDEADLVLFNTCAIRDLSNQKFYSQLGETKHLKTNNPKLKVGIAGCVAQTEGKKLVKKYDQLDFAFGTDQIDSINDFIFRTYSGDDKFSVNQWDRSADYSIETKITNGSPQAFVNIIKGCDKFCSYCIVPFTRGREKSRRLKEVVEDIRKLVEHSGIQEVTLLGQNVNSYGKENNENLSQLLMALEDINGLEIVRYTTSHPYDVSDELIEVHGAAKKLSKHLHLPVQCGSNSVLKRMRREYTVEHYMGLIEKLRKAQPEIVLSTDIIVGFPNETEEEYQGTLDLLEKVKYDFIYAYSFSPRQGTKAARMQDSLTDDDRGVRLRHLQAFQNQIQEKVRQSLVGKTFKVLIEGEKTFQGAKKWKGRTNCFRIVHFEGPENLQWKWADVEITSATAFSCQGKLIKTY